MAEWLVEAGIGETRCALIDKDQIIEARILLDGNARAGELLVAKLKMAGVPAVAESDGQEYLLPKGAPGATQGATISVEITRERIPGAEPWKRALARFVKLGGQAAPAPALDAKMLPFPAATDRLASAGWDDLIDEARSGVVRFTGGELRVSATPAMTLIDVDGYLPPAELAIRGAAEAAKAVRRLDIGGSIGIDLPTVAGKAARQAPAEAIDAILPQPFERTGVNGFGFVQIIRPRDRASLIELAQGRAAFEARALLRRAAFSPPGAKRLVAHPAVIAVFEARPDWLATLARQIGGTADLHADSSLAISAGHVANS